MIRALRNLLLLTALALLALPAVALAANPKSIALDCIYDGDLDKSYSHADLRRALDRIPSDQQEYGDCQEIIERAIASNLQKQKENSGGDSGGGGAGASGGGGGGSGSISAEEQQARANDNAELGAITGAKRAPQVNVGGEQLTPGGNGLFDLASASNDVPMPLVLALIAIGLLALAGAAVALRHRVPGLARIPLVSKIPRVSLPRLRR